MERLQGPSSSSQPTDPIEPAPVGPLGPDLGEAVLAGLPMPVFVKDVTGKYIYCNNAFCQLVGLTSAAILGRTVFDLVPADLAETYHKADLALLARGGRQVYDADLQTAHRGPRPVRFEKSLTVLPGREAPVIIGLVHDLGQRRERIAGGPAVGNETGRRLLDGILGRFTRALAQSATRDTQAPLQTLLGELGDHLGVDRAFVLGLTMEGDADPSAAGAVSSSWTRDGVAPHARPLVGATLDQDLPWLGARLRGTGVITLDDRLTLPEEAERERIRLDAVGVRAAILVPLRAGSETFGVVGVDMATASRAWSPADVSAMRLIAHTLSHALDRARVESVLRASERNFRAFFESMNDIITVATPDGRIRTGNRALTQTLRYSDSTLRDMTVVDLHPPQRRAEAEALFAEMVTGVRDTCPLPLLTADGRHIPAETRVWPGVWDGRPCIFGVSKDLTAELDVKTWFERLFRNNPAPMALTALSDHRFLDVNDAWQALIGYRREEVLGQPAMALGLFAEPAQAEPLLQSLIRTGRLSDAEISVRCRDGRRLCGLFHIEVLERQDGAMALSVMIDVTARKQAEDRLASSEEQFRLALEASRDGLWDWDVDSKRVTWHPRCFTMLGYPPDAFQVSFETWRELMHPDDRAAAEQEVGRGLQEGRAFSIEFRLRRADGDWLWILGRGKAVAWDDSGRPTRVIGTHSDIEAQKRSERSLAEARIAAEHASRAKSEFLASMSHELRTPLNSVIGFSSLLLDGTFGPLGNERVSEYLNDIRGSGEHLLGLINDILDLSAVEAGKMEIDSQPVDVAEVCHNSARFVAAMAHQQSVTVDLDMADGLPPLIGDERRIRQVLLNLLSNAIKYTPTGGTVSLTARRTYDGGLALSVADTGVGMDADGLAKAMRPFERTENVLSRRHDGIGLGLPLSARLMMLHDGTLTLDSAPGQGTVAKAVFPPSRLDVGEA